MTQPKRAPRIAKSPAEAVLLIESAFHAALGNPGFLKMLLHLYRVGSDEVCDLAEAAGLRHANASAALRRAAREGILARRKDSIYVFYSIDDQWADAVAEVAARVGAA